MKSQIPLFKINYILIFECNQPPFKCSFIHLFIKKHKNLDVSKS